MNNSILAAFECFKGFEDNMLPSLSENLNGYVIGDSVCLDKSAEEIILRFACGRKTNFNFLKADFNKEVKEAEFLLNAHRDNKRLISVTQINGTPCRSFIYIFLFNPLILIDRGIKVLSFISFKIFHKSIYSLQ